jgi:hypothetical protein
MLIFKSNIHSFFKLIQSNLSERTLHISGEAVKFTRDKRDPGGGGRGTERIFRKALNRGMHLKIFARSRIKDYQLKGCLMGQRCKKTLQEAILG